MELRDSPPVESVAQIGAERERSTLNLVEAPCLDHLSQIESQNGFEDCYARVPQTVTFSQRTDRTRRRVVVFIECFSQHFD